MIKFVSIACVVLLVALSSLSVNAGKFYKWVDEEGDTHYSQRPPAKTGASVVKTYNDQGHSVPVSPQKKEKTGVNKAVSAVPVIKKDKALCKKAKNNIHVLKSQPMIMQEGKLMTIDAKNKQVKTAQGIVNIHC